MSTALDQLFETSRSANKAVLIGYLPAGFPTQKASKKIIKAMIDGGVDAIEIGFPYSDPVMDGPVIQAASEEAIKNGVGVDQVFELMKSSVDSGHEYLVHLRMRNMKRWCGRFLLRGSLQYGEECEVYIFQPAAFGEVDVTHSWIEFSSRHPPLKSPRNICLTSKVSDYGRANAS